MPKIFGHQHRDVKRLRAFRPGLIRAVAFVYFHVVAAFRGREWLDHSSCRENIVKTDLVFQEAGGGHIITLVGVHIG